MAKKIHLSFLMQDIESGDFENSPKELFMHLIYKLIRMDYVSLIIENKNLDILQVCYALKENEDFRLRYYQKEVPLGMFL